MSGTGSTIVSTVNIGYCEPCCHAQPAPPYEIICGCKVRGVNVEISGWQDCTIIYLLNLNGVQTDCKDQVNHYLQSAFNRTFNLQYKQPADQVLGEFELLLGAEADCSQKGLKYSDAETYSSRLDLDPANCNVLLTKYSYYMWGMAAGGITCLENGDGSFHVKGSLIGAYCAYADLDVFADPTGCISGQGERCGGDTYGFEGTITNCNDVITMICPHQSVCGWPGAEPYDPADNNGSDCDKNGPITIKVSFVT